METPLLADPPIDDDDYNYEEQKFPTALQTHLLYSVYTLTSLVSKIFESICPIILCTLYPKNLIAVSLYAAISVILSPKLEKWGRTEIARTSRFRLMKSTILIQRLLPIAACFLSIGVETWKVRGLLRHLSIIVLTVCFGMARAASATSLVALESDWAQIMSNEQSAVYDAIVMNMQRINIVASLSGFVVGGLLLTSLWVLMTLKVLRVLLFLSMLIEFSTIWQLYSTCYALSVPRPYHPDISANVRSMLTGPTFARMIQYIARKPRPVICTLGVVLVKSSIIGFGPQFIFYLYNRKHLPVLLVTILPSIQLLSHVIPLRFPVSVAAAVDAFAIIGVMLAVKSDTTNSGYVAALLIILSRLCLQTIDLTAQWFAEDLVNDLTAIGIFRQAEVGLQRFFEFASQLFTLLWYKPDIFALPITISGCLAILGLLLFTVSRSSAASFNLRP